jgi:uncharacterized protein YqeY
MAATLKEQIQEDMKTAMRAQDKERLATIRLILSALKQREVDDRIILTDAFWTRWSNSAVTLLLNMKLEIALI